MEHYCTLFDHTYLSRGLTLYRSLQDHHPGEFVLWVLCLDDLTHDAITKFDAHGLRPIPLSEFERHDAAVALTKRSRSLAEYYFSCTAAWCLFLLRQFPEITRITYLDADLYFFSDPSPIFHEMDEASILIIPHRFPSQMTLLEQQFGIYNVGLLSFANDEIGRECLVWWRERCLEWCFDRVEDGKFADQKYLDDWPQRFANVKILHHKGANLAPWNWVNYKIRTADGRIMVDEQVLIFYHYQGLKLLNPWMYDPGYADYGRMPAETRDQLYPPYIDSVRQAYHLVREVVPSIVPGYTKIQSRSYRWLTLIKHLLQGEIIFLSEPL